MPLDTPRNPFKSDRYDLLTVQVANPVPGDPVLYTVPDNDVIHIVGVLVRLTTDATVIARRIYISILNVPDRWPIQRSTANIGQDANLAWDYWFSCGVDPVGNTAIDNAHSHRLAFGLQLKGEEILEVSAYQLQPGDLLTDCYIRFYSWSQD